MIALNDDIQGAKGLETVLIEGKAASMVNWNEQAGNSGEHNAIIEIINTYWDILLVTPVI